MEDGCLGCTGASTEISKPLDHKKHSHGWQLNHDTSPTVIQAPHQSHGNNRGKGWEERGRRRLIFLLRFLFLR